MGAFLCMLTDGDLEVRKSCLLMVNAVTHHHPEVVAPFLRDQVSECVREGVCVCVSEGGREGGSVCVCERVNEIERKVVGKRSDRKE